MAPGQPHCHRSSCVLQIFFRGKLAIQRLEEIIKSGVLISGSDSTTDHAVSLYNRLQMLKTQKLHLKEKRTLFISDDDLEETILVFRNEIECVQNCLRNIALLSSGDTR